MGIRYFLESAQRLEGIASRIELPTFPVSIGRHHDSGIAIASAKMSRNHASIELIGEQLILRDLNSTNGTFVNHQRVSEPTPIKERDILHFANIEFRLRTMETVDDDTDGSYTSFESGELSNEFSLHSQDLLDMIEFNMVLGFKQPIVRGDGSLYAYELLGRGDHPSLDTSPYEIFRLAADINKEVELSEALRAKGFAESEAAGLTVPLFFNTHPLETKDPQRLLQNLETLRSRHPSLNLVFEVHEAAVTNHTVMREINAGLAAMGIGLAYDDFGAGQARLLELIEVPPQILKFDIGLISGVDDTSSPKSRMLSSLNNLVKDMGITTLAEGVETAGEAAACIDMGIDLYQGYHFGRPEAIDPRRR
ncbi:EAL domain-containing protein [Spongiibacter sp. KMU-166]|uniref:EAL domain-containing protein n=1 Tax=Spongiibacter thalassae TaxID=2721624 RepID=A0ABX1GCP3_9GAMM|nr:EAL domain-containing protein [Spongiibacter thalassae]NKI16263.1 EAL domain-containing protein [Spongiibacter thalassae]